MNLMDKILGRATQLDVWGVEGGDGYYRFQFQGDIGGNHHTDNHRPHVRYGHHGETYGKRDHNGNPV